MATRIPTASSSALTATKFTPYYCYSSLSGRLKQTSSAASFITASKSLKRQTPRTHRFFHTSIPSESAAPTFSYRIAASFSAKDVPHNINHNIYNYDPHTYQHQKRPDDLKNKRPKSGQDAFFVSRIGESKDVALGVCDGVGGWQDSGVDPADFSHGICNYMASAANTSTAMKKEWTPQRLMQRGYDDICKDPTVRAGGSTACVAVAKSTGDLEVANLGDSGFVQLRLNAIHSYSEPQTHAFNTPYQLSLIPGNIQARAAAFGGEQLHDMPSDASITKHKLRHGDILVFATDGVWDNLSSQSILQIVSEMMIRTEAWEHSAKGISVGNRLNLFTKRESDSVEGSGTPLDTLQAYMAVSIAMTAKAASENTKVDGPFAREVQKYFPEEGWRGGKVDDICVIVAIAVEDGK